MQTISSVDAAADEIIKQTEGQIRLAIPLGMGKPNQLVNALYRKAAEDPNISLDIFTALSLERPRGGSGLESRFLKPYADRIYEDYEDLDYSVAIRKKSLPKNINIHEFFVRPGAELNNRYAQQHYMSSNYTHVARDLDLCQVNVLAQMLAIEESGENARFSFSCNPEVTLDLLPLVNVRKEKGEKILTIGQINKHLPFMENHAELDVGHLDILINDPDAHKALFSTPNMPVNPIEHFIGLNASCLVKDGGTLQVGIGALGDALAYSLLLREQRNDIYKKVIAAGGINDKNEELISKEGGLGVFNKGLYACTEMFTYGLFRLLEENIIRRSVQDADGKNIIMHGGFFLGPKIMYEKLRSLVPEKRKLIDLLNISFVNGLYGQEELKREQRVDARFINSAFSMTLMGAGVADQLEDGRVLSGVGGQYNFVAQAHELEGARSILLLRATRSSGGQLSSNIIWSYGHTTIPRHLRDIVVTEYGIADLRSKSDSECIKAMLNIADSRFQDELMEQAKQNGKLESDYEIPKQYLENFPNRLNEAMKYFLEDGYFPDYPLGTDFNEIEQDLLKALTWLKAHVKRDKFFELVKKLNVRSEQEHQLQKHLERMGLEKVASIKDRVYRQLLLAALVETQ